MNLFMGPSKNEKSSIRRALLAMPSPPGFVKVGFRDRSRKYYITVHWTESCDWVKLVWNSVRQVLSDHGMSAYLTSGGWINANATFRIISK